MKKEIHYFLTAILFLTRIPCPKWVDHSPEILKKSNRYFSLVGILIGVVAAGTYYIATFLFTTEIALILSMISSIYTTGAFHEDGFADTCDGFGGGWTKEKILMIMKDSRLGTFGVIGLISILALKYIAIHTLVISDFNICVIIISGHSISRFAATLLVCTYPYVRDVESSKVKQSSHKMDFKSVLISAFFGLLPLCFFQNYSVFLALLPLLATFLYLGQFFKKWIGGQTGDCAGALQQVSEIVFYLSLVAIWKLFL